MVFVCRLILRLLITEPAMTHSGQNRPPVAGDDHQGSISSGNQQLDLSLELFSAWG